MGLVDKFLNVMKLNPDEDDDYDYDLEDEYDDDEEEESTRSFFKRSSKHEDTYDKVEDNKSREKVTKSSKVTPMRTNKRQVVGMEVCVIRPNAFEDAREITDTLTNGRTVVLNVEGLNVEVAQRIIDFASGSCYAMRGNLQKISNYIFIITPENVDISGDFQDILGSFDVAPLHTEL